MTLIELHLGLTSHVATRRTHVLLACGIATALSLQRESLAMTCVHKVSYNTAHMSYKRLVIFSHGFGVRQDAQGLFTDIVSSMGTRILPVLFDYNTFDDAKKICNVSSLSDQARILERHILSSRQLHSDLPITLICHSQGCVIPCLANLNRINRIILLAPPLSMDIQRTITRIGKRPGTIIDLEGTSSLTRSDGTTSIIPAAYWQERQALNMSELYAKLAKVAPTTCILAGADEVLGSTDFSQFEVSQVVIPHADHNFTGDARNLLLDAVESVLINETA